MMAYEWCSARSKALGGSRSEASGAVTRPPLYPMTDILSFLVQLLGRIWLAFWSPWWFWAAVFVAGTILIVELA